MSDKLFFKPTNLYKEYILLDLIEKNSHITQREMALNVGISVSTVNVFLDLYEIKGLIYRSKTTNRDVEYLITKKGIERKKILNMGYLNSTKKLYFEAKDNIEIFLQQIYFKGFKKILLYGAGDVAEMLIHAIVTSKTNKVEVLALIDDDSKKIDSKIANYDIISNDRINKYHHDGIIISTYSRKDEIKNKLSKNNYPKDKIIEFF